MKFLRTASTKRLLATFTGLAVAAIAGTAIAVAASGSGPAPASAPLAQAIHDGIGTSNLQGLSATVEFTNNLIPASNLQGSDPLLNGTKRGRIWVTRDRLRLELQSDSGDAQVLVSNGSFSVYDPASKTVYQGTLPASGGQADKPAQAEAIPSVAQIQSELAKLARHLTLPALATGTDFGGQPAYQVSISPKHSGGLLGSAQLAWDSAVRGLPLQVAVYARNQTAPVLELKATQVTLGAVPASAFAVSPPAGTKVVKVATPGGGAAAAAKDAGAKADKAKAQAKAKAKDKAKVQGVAAVARHVPFTLAAPPTLVGLPRHSATLLDWAGHPAALVTYGQNLGGVAVIEQAADTAKSSIPSPTAGSGGDRHRGLNLPTVSINGATGQELDTALGTMVRFTHAGVSYTVLGSVAPTAAEYAAKALVKP